jgi:2-aminoethylphosphonate-pyruvate transaminase
VSLDLLAQWKGFEKNGQFRFTPPTHVVLAFEQALKELEAEGGVAGRGNRYHANHRVLIEGMVRLGFAPFLPAQTQSYIITSFHFPKDPRFTFEAFYRGLSDKGFIIYPGKISQVDLFRIGSIGRLTAADMESLLAGVALTLDQMGVARPRS